MEGSTSCGSPDNVSTLLICSVCKTIVVSDSIIGSTETDYLVDKVTNVEFDDVINEHGNIYIFCPECWVLIGHCDVNHENKRFYKNLLIKAFVNGIQNQKPAHSSTS
ncbi:hypothetical protein TNIN_253951 [Trichonephila inaurata madagascariensis]|uniref:Uncharacterized protein n=1 Tax=Trichonephila inaurata madagascariensis TaxID=2747483 RepID=A0A8X6Y7Z4_9ARAC|nr:hypothetical protein TNIN_253951 [Trichonephila inaurata madagascariensis]